MSSVESSSQRVAIIGAGLTGLLAAQGLKKNGFEAVVFEREASLDARGRDWTMLVHWAMPIFEKVLPDDILADLPRTWCNPYLTFDDHVESLPCYSGVTGDLLFKSATPGARRVSRQALRRLLARNISIQWNRGLSKLTPISSGTRLEFQSGDEFEADHVLGADGSSSKVRELLLGIEEAKSQRSGFLIATGITKYGDEDKTDEIVKTHPVAALMMGNGSVGAVGSTMSVDDPNDKSTWTTFWVKIWRGHSIQLRGQEALDFIKEKTSPLLGLFQSAIDWTPKGSSIYIDEMKYWIPVPWSNYGGRATLAGDAAHPMLIYRGQGFQHSITDVYNYVDSLVQLRASGSDAAARQRLLGAYEDEMIARGGKAVQQSITEAAKSFDLQTVGKMVMATQGHGRSAS